MMPWHFVLIVCPAAGLIGVAIGLLLCSQQVSQLELALGQMGLMVQFMNR